MAQLEIACFHPASAIIAQENGADRIELCAGFEVGGTTPSVEATLKTRELVTIDLYVMIRPRGGNFTYTDEEFGQMKKEIVELKKINVNGFVFGILKEDSTINIKQNAELVQLAKPFPCTFHKAFDEVTDAFQALEEIIECGFTTLLTSGQSHTVTEGMNRIAGLVTKADNRIIIMPGGGLRSDIIASIQKNTKAVFFHSSAITDGSQLPNPNEVEALKSYLQ